MVVVVVVVVAVVVFRVVRWVCTEERSWAAEAIRGDQAAVRFAGVGSPRGRGRTTKAVTHRT